MGKQKKEDNGKNRVLKHIEENSKSFPVVSHIMEIIQDRVNHEIETLSI